MQHLKHSLSGWLRSTLGAHNSHITWTIFHLWDLQARANQLATSQALAAELGVPLDQDETEGPVSRLTYLGILLDSICGRSHLPINKLVALRAVLSGVIRKGKRHFKRNSGTAGSPKFSLKGSLLWQAFCAWLSHIPWPGYLPLTITTGLHVARKKTSGFGWNF